MNQKNVRALATAIACLTVSFFIVHAQTRVMSLSDMYRIADENSQSQKVYATALECATEGVKAAKRALLPDINLSLSGSYIGNATLMDRRFSTRGSTDIIYAIAPYVGHAYLGKQDTPHWGNNFAFEASQVLYAGGAISAGIRMAEFGQQIAMLDKQKNQQELRFLLTGHYLNLYKLQNLQLVLQKNIELTCRIMGQMQSRHEQGMVLKSDITRFELLVQNLKLELSKLKDATQIINHQLVTTLHLPEGTQILPDTTLLIQCEMLNNSTDSTQWQTQASANNIGIKQAELGVLMAQQRLKAAQSASMPHVALVAEDQLGGPYVNDLIPSNVNTNAWFVGLGIHYSLSSLYKNNSEIRKARLNVQKSTEEMALAQEGIVNGVQACYVDYQTAFNEVHTQQKNVELATENYDVISRRYENDLALLTDMLDASNTHLAADMALVNSQINLIYSYYKLKYFTHSL